MSQKGIKSSNRFSKKSMLAMAVAAAMGGGLLQSSTTTAATMYFTDVGGPLTWNTTNTNWGTVSGGPYTSVNNTYNDDVFEGTGGTVTVSGSVNANSLTFNVNNYVLSGGTIVIGNPTTPGLFVLTGDTATIGSALTTSGAGSTIHIGKASYLGTLILTGSASGINNRIVSIDGGTLQLGNGATGNDTSLASATSITDNAALIFNYFGSVTYANIISGTGTVTKSGNGTLYLTGSNTYSGGTTLSAGTLAVGNGGNENASALGTGTVTLTGGLLWFQPGSTSTPYTFANSFVLNGGIIRGEDGNQHLGSGNSPFVVGASGGTVQATWSTKDVYVDGLVSGSGALTLSHGTTTGSQSGIHFTNSSNTYSGTVSVSGAGQGVVLEIDNPTALQFATLSLNPGTAGTALINNSTGATLAGLTGTAGTLKAFTSGTEVLTLNDAVNFSYGGTLVNNGGVLALIKAGVGTQTLSGANTYTGATTVNAGVLKAGVASVANTSGAFGNNSAITMGTASTAVLDITGFNTQIGSLAGGGGSGGNVTLGAATLTLGGDNTSPAAYLGAISGTGAVIKIGTGTETFSGANLYSGNTSVNAGKLQVNNGIVSTSATGTGTVTVASAASLVVGSSGANIGTAAGGGALVINGGGTITIGTAAKLTLPFNGSGATDLTIGDASGNAAILNLVVGNSTANSSNITVTQGVSVGTSGGVINLTGVNPGAGSFNLITSTAVTSGTLSNLTLGSITNGGLFTYAIGTDNSGLYSTVTLTAVSDPGTLFWNGSINGVWSTDNANATNWRNAATGGSDLGIIPQASDVVEFATTTNSTLATTLGQNLAIKSLTIDSNVTGAASIGGTNTLTLTPSSSSTGITVNSGTLTISAPVALGANQTWTNNSAGTLTVSGAIANGGNTLTLAGSGITISGGLTGTGGLIMNGSGAVTLSGNANLYSGGTTVSSGTLVLAGTSNDFTASSGYNVAAGATLQFTPSVRFASTNAQFTGAGTVQYTGTGTAYFANNGGSTQMSFNMSAGGLLDVRSGIMNSISTQAGNLGGLNILSGATASLNTGGISAATDVFNTLTGGGTLTLDGAGTNRTVSVGANNGSATFSGVIKDNSAILSFTKIGTGTQALTGTNTYSGATTINASGGTLQISGSGSLGSGSYAGAIAIGASGTFEYSSSAAETLSGAITGLGTLTKDTSSASTLTLSGSGANTFSGLTSVSAGELDLGKTGVNAIGGNLTITGGTVKLTGTGGDQIANAGNVVVSGGTLNLVALNETVNGVQLTSGTITGTTGILTSATAYDFQAGTASAILGGGVALNKTTTGTVILSGANTFTGLTTISAGTLSINAIAAIGSPQPLGENAALTLGGAATAGTLVYTGGTGTLAQAITIGTGNGVISNTGGSTLTLTGGINKNATVFTFLGGIFNITTTGISGAAANSDLVVDAATVTLGVADTYNGPTKILDGGAITANVANALPTANGRSAVTMDASGTGSSNLTLGASQLIASLTGAATSTVNLNANTLTIGAASGSTAFAGAISGASGSLTKDLSSTQTLSGLNTYTGGTAVNGGTLLLDMSANPTGVLSGSSALTLGGGTLNILGQSGGVSTQTLASLSLTAGTGSRIVLNPGTGSGTTLTLTSPTVTAGAAVNFNYSAGTTNGATVGNDIIAWNAGLTSGIIGGGYTVTDLGGTGYATVSGGKVVRLATGTALPRTGGTSTVNYFVNSSFSTVSTTTDGSLVEALSGNVVANTVTVDTTGLASGANLALGANSLTITNGGGFTFTGANPYSITATGAGGLKTSAAGGATIFNNYNSSMVTIGAPILNNSASTAMFNGTGITILTGANTYAGGTTVTGGTLQLGDGTTQPTIVGNYNVASGALLRFKFNTATGVAGAPTLSTVTGAGTLALASGKTFDTGWGTPALPAGFTGTLQIEGGRIVPTSVSSLGGATSITVLNGGQLALYSFGNNTLTQNFTLAGTGYGENGYQSAIRLANSGQATTLTGNIALSASATLAATGTSTLQGIISGASGSGLTFGTSSQAGTVVLTGANTYSGNTTLSYGVLQIGGAGSLGTGSYAGTIAIASGTTLKYSSSAAQTLSGVISGAGAITKDTSSSTLILSGSNTYTGTTTVTSGTLVISGSPTGNSAMTVNGAALLLDYSTNNTSKINDSAVLTLGGSTVTLSGGSHTEIVASTTLNAGYSAVTRSSGTSVLQLGTITLNAGAYVDFGANDIATTSNTNTNGILGTWATVGGTDWAFNSTNAANGLIEAYTGYTDVTRLSSGTKAIANAAASNVRIIEGTGSAGSITLGAAVTSINSLNQSVSGGTSAATINLAGQTLTLGSILESAGAGSLTIGAAAGNGTLTAGTAGGTLTLINNSSNAFAVNSVIADNTSASPLTIAGTGTVSLNGANTYSGATAIYGTLNVSGAGTLGAGNYAGAITNNGALLLSSSAAQTLNAISGSGTLTKTGAAQLTLGASTTFIGATNINAGTLYMSGDNLQSSSSVTMLNSALTVTANAVGGGYPTNTYHINNLTLNNATLNVLQSGNGGAAAALANQITILGSSILNQNNGGYETAAYLNGGLSGNGTLTLNLLHNSGDVVFIQGNNSGFSGTLNVATVTGSDVVDIESTYGWGVGSTLIDATGTVWVNNSGTPGGGNYGHTAVTTDINQPTSLLVVKSGSKFNTSVNMTIGSLNGNGGTITLVANKTLNVGALGTTDLFGGVIAGAGGFTKSGTGSMTLTGSSTYTGATTISQGTLVVSNIAVSGGASNLGNASSAVALGDATHTGILSYTGNSANYVSGFTVNAGGGEIDVTTAGQNLTVGTANITGTGGLTKGGPGSLTLSTSNTYSGNTTVSNGRLIESNTTGSATGTGTVTIASGAALAGSQTASQGIISGKVNINGGGTLAAFQVAPLAINNTLALNADSGAGSNLNFTLTNTPNGNINPLISAGSLVLTGTGNNNITVSGPVAVGTYDLIGYSGTVANFAGFNTAVTGPGGVLYALVNNAGQNQIDLAVFNSFTWTGQDNGTGTLNSAWDTTSINWAGTGTTTPLPYANGYGAIFGDTNIANGSVTLGTPQSVVIQAAGITPASVTFNNSTAVNYLLQNAGTLGITGATGVTKNGTGTVVFNSTNTYTGVTTINGGILQVNVDHALGSNASATVTLGGELLLNNLAYTAQTLTIAGSGTSSAGALAGTGNSSFAGAINLAGDATIGAASGSTLTLTGTVNGASANLTFGGGGKININNATGISGSPNSVVASDAGTNLFLNVTNTYNSSDTRIINNATMTLGTNSVFPNSPATNLTIGTGSDTSSTLNLNSFSDNNLAIITLNRGTISGGAGVGTLSIGSAVVSGSGNLIATGTTVKTASSTVLNDSSTLTLDGTLLGAANLGNSSGTATLMGTGTLSTATMRFASNTLSSAGTLTVTGTLNVGTGIGDGSLGNHIASGTVAVGSTTFVRNNLTIDSGAILTGAGSVTVTAGTSFKVDGTAAKAVSVGTGLLLGTGSATGPVTLSGGDISSSNTLTLGGTLGVSGTGSTISTGMVAVAGTTTINSGADFSVLSPATLAGAGSVTVGGGGASLNVNGIVAKAVNLNNSGLLSGTGSVTGAVNLAGNNDISSSNTLTLGSTLGVSGTGNTISTGTVAVTGATTINSGAALLVNGALAGASTTSVTGTLTVGDSSHTGATLSSTGVTISSGGILAGHGTINAPVSVSSGAHVAPGGSVGTLSVSSMTIASGTNYDYDFGSATGSTHAAPGTSDSINITANAINTLVFPSGSFITLNLASGGSNFTSGSGSYEIFSYANTGAVQNFTSGNGLTGSVHLAGFGSQTFSIVNDPAHLGIFLDFANDTSNFSITTPTVVSGNVSLNLLRNLTTGKAANGSVTITNGGGTSGSYTVTGAGNLSVPSGSSGTLASSTSAVAGLAFSDSISNYGDSVATGSLTLQGSVPSNTQNITASAASVGLATVGGGHTFGTPLTGYVLNGEAFTGLSSQTARDLPGAGTLGTTATIVSSATFLSAGSTMVSEAWRTRTGTEAATVPVVSDVVQITGTGGTDYVLQMSYNPLDLPSYLTGYEDHLNLGELIGGNWTLAAANDNGGSVTTTRFLGGWAAVDNTLTLGDYGVDTTNHVVWAVLDHDGTFAVIPEPTSLGLLGLGALGLLGRRRKNRA
jgi:fibronectin-binding autotransporter adhesin